jgi:hypothetical protein
VGSSVPLSSSGTCSSRSGGRAPGEASTNLWSSYCHGLKWLIFSSTYIPLAKASQGNKPLISGECSSLWAQSEYLLSSNPSPDFLYLSSCIYLDKEMLCKDRGIRNFYI